MYVFVETRVRMMDSRDGSIWSVSEEIRGEACPDHGPAPLVAEVDRLAGQVVALARSQVQARFPEPAPAPSALNLEALTAAIYDADPESSNGEAKLLAKSLADRGVTAPVSRWATTSAVPDE